MRKHKLAAGVMTLAVATGSLLSPMNLSNVNAAEVTDKPMIDFELAGDYTEKRVSDADAAVINQTMGYTFGDGIVYICGKDTSGYINWENSSVELWKVYETRIFQPKFSRDEEGNLVFEQYEDSWARYDLGATTWRGCSSHSGVLLETSYPSGAFFSQGFTILGKDVNDTNLMSDYYINHHLGKIQGYNSQTEQEEEASDVYVIRISYTTDDKPNKEALVLEDICSGRRYLRPKSAGRW